MFSRWQRCSPHWVAVVRSTALAILLAGAGAPGAGAAAGAGFAFRTNDVIAFVGGEDVVAMQHNGYLELLLTATLPHHQLRFRNLAFEGDTVFEQHRQLNWPSWEKQLERVGATVVIAQFGQAESLQGTNGLGRFVEAYSKLLDRFTNGARRFLLLSPTPFQHERQAPPRLVASKEGFRQFVVASTNLASRRGFTFADVSTQFGLTTRDGIHLDDSGHWLFGLLLMQSMGLNPPWSATSVAPPGVMESMEAEKLRQLILAKNRLWFDYWRPQNWAFLHGDRTEQASSRDHRDPKKRWFPEEMQKFLPLIEAKEREIWEVAGKLR